METAVSVNGGAMRAPLWRVLTRPEGEPVPAVQHLLAIARPLAVRVRSVRRPFRPSPGEGPYRLPREVRDRLTSALAPFRNREAAFTLATFLARYHSHADRLLQAFAIDRRALLGHADLDLTEKRIRSAITTLEAVGFLDRAIPPPGSRYKATEYGLHRKPIQFAFGAEYGLLFTKANQRARRARGADPAARRTLPAATRPRPSAGLLKGSPLKSPKNKSEADTQVYLGHLTTGTGLPAEPSAPSALDLALQRLSEGVFGKPRLGTDE